MAMITVVHYTSGGSAFPPGGTWPKISKLLAKPGHIIKTDPSGHASRSTDTSHSCCLLAKGIILNSLFFSHLLIPLFRIGRSLSETSRTFSLSVAQRRFHRFHPVGLTLHHPTSLHAAERQIFPSTERLNGFTPLHALYIGLGPRVGSIECKEVFISLSCPAST
jgi:hypothetical protein